MKNKNGFTLTEVIMSIACIFILIVFLLSGIGWVKNLVKLMRCDFESPYKAEAIRMIGVLSPVGAVVGWVNIDDGNNN